MTDCKTSFTFHEELDAFMNHYASDDLYHCDYGYHLKTEVPDLFFSPCTNSDYSTFLNQLMKQSLVLSLYRGMDVMPPSTVCGLYAIYKDDECLYVGQSTTLGKRILQHVTETQRYCDFDKIVCFFAEARLDGEEWYRDYDNDGYFIPSQHHKRLLDLNEYFLIDLLNPTDNILRKSYSDENCSEIFNYFYRARNVGKAKELKDFADFVIDRTDNGFTILGGLKALNLYKSKFIKGENNNEI